MAEIARDSTNNAAWIPVPDVWMATAFTLSVLTSPLIGLRGLPPEMGLAFMALELVVVGSTVYVPYGCPEPVPTARHYWSRSVRQSC
jgi:hypothetical protein